MGVGGGCGSAWGLGCLFHILQAGGLFLWAALAPLGFGGCWFILGPCSGVPWQYSGTQCGLSVLGVELVMFCFLAWCPAR